MRFIVFFMCLANVSVAQEDGPLLESASLGFWASLGADRNENHPQKGVMISTDVEDPHPGTGLSAGDYVSKLNGMPVNTPDAFNSAVRSVKAGQSVEVTFFDRVSLTNGNAKWNAAKKVKIAAGSYKEALMKKYIPIADDLGEEWYQTSREPYYENEKVTLTMKFQVKDGVAIKPTLIFVYCGDDGVSADTAVVGSGENRMEFKGSRVQKDALEKLYCPVDSETLSAVRSSINSKNSMLIMRRGSRVKSNGVNDFNKSEIAEQLLAYKAFGGR